MFSEIFVWVKSCAGNLLCLLYLHQVDPANALRIVNDFIQNGHPVAMVWGPAFSSVAVVINEVLPRYNIVQVRILRRENFKT